MLKRVSIVCMLALLISVLGAASVSAQPSLTTPQLVKQGDAICAKAIKQMKAAGRVSTLEHPTAAMTAAASKGTRWLAVDNSAFKALKALHTSDAGDAAEFNIMLTSHQAATAALAKAVKAAKAGSKAAFMTHFVKAGTLAGRFAIHAWGLDFKQCKDWTL
jgi:hypothetical protein